MRSTTTKINGQQGFATLVFTMIVLSSITLFAFISAQTVINKQQNIVSLYKEKSAFNAAQAGLDYAVAYLTKNYATLADNGTLQVSMNNGGYAVVTFKFQGDKNLISMTSVGHSNGDTNTSTIKQLAKYQNSGSSKTLSLPIIARKGLTLGGNSEVIGNGADLASAKIGSDDTSSVTISGVAVTRMPGIVNPVSSPAKLGADIFFDSNLFLGKSNSEIETEILSKTIDEFSTVTTQTAQTVRTGMGGVTLSSDSSGGQTAALLQLSSTFFSTYASNKSITLKIKALP